MFSLTDHWRHCTVVLVWRGEFRGAYLVQQRWQNDMSEDDSWPTTTGRRRRPLPLRPCATTHNAAMLLLFVWPIRLATQNRTSCRPFDQPWACSYHWRHSAYIITIGQSAVSSKQRSHSVGSQAGNETRGIVSRELRLHVGWRSASVARWRLPSERALDDRATL